MSQEEIQDLEPHQYQDIYAVDDAPLDDIGGEIARQLIYFGLGMVVILAILSFVITIPREIKVPFVLMGGKKEQVFQYAHKIYVRDKWVRTGAAVHPGDSLFAITSPEIVDHIQGIEEVKNQLDFLENEERQTHSQKLANKRQKIDGLIEYIRLTRQEITTTQRTQASATAGLARTIALLRKNYARDSILYHQHVVALSELEDSERELQQAISERVYTEESYEVQLINLKVNLQAFQMDKQNEEIAYREAVLSFETRRQKLQAELKQKQSNLALDYGKFAIRGNELLLISEQAGTVSMIHESESEIPSEHILAKIETDTQDHHVYIEAEPHQIGQIKAGQKTILKFTSFPHYYYGVMEATITSISTSPNQAGQFLIRAEITDTGDLAAHVTKGMTGQGNIILEDKVIFDHLFRVFLEKTSWD